MRARRDTESLAANPTTHALLLLDVADVQQLTGLGRTKAYELVESGEIPSIRIGRARKVPYVALLEWIQKKLKET
jgi:excisionase family DNA binding protein